MSVAPASLGRRLAVAALALLATSLAVAQTTYRWTDPASGRTVFSDTPPPSGAKNIQQQRGDAGRPGESGQTFAGRRAASNQPVTLYTTGTCVNECRDARDFLKKRNIPFAEKEIRTQADLDDLRKLIGGEGMVPSLQVGKQPAAGFQPDQWNRLLDQAGYPGTH